MLRSRLEPLTTRSIEDVVKLIATNYGNLNRSRDLREFLPSNISLLLDYAKLGYKPINERQFIMYAITDPYFLRNSQNRHFYFPGGIPVGRNLVISGDKILLTGKPMILTPEHYNHPFVYSNNEICFASDDRWNENGIFWNSPYSLNDAVTYRKIAYWLNEGKVALKDGYFGRVKPVHDITWLNFLGELTFESLARQGRTPIVDARRTE